MRRKRKLKQSRGDGFVDEAQLRREERIGRAWRVRDDALWNPFEVVAYVGLIVFAFGFLLGHGKYMFAAELFLPVLIVGALVVLWQAVMRYRAGEPGVLKVLIERIR